MTLIHPREKRERKARAKAFWRRAGRFQGAMIGLTCLGYALGYGYVEGLRSTVATFPDAVMGTVGVALVAGWVPLGLFYEGHRFRWIYIVAYYVLALIAALFIGYASAPQLN